MSQETVQAHGSAKYVGAAEPTTRSHETAIPEAKGISKFQKLQNVFDNSAASLTQPVKHDQTSVLLLSWEGGDMDVSDEVREYSSRCIMLLL